MDAAEPLSQGRKRATKRLNEIITTVFEKQPLALAGSAKYLILTKAKKYMSVLNIYSDGNREYYCSPVELYRTYEKFFAMNLINYFLAKKKIFIIFKNMTIFPGLLFSH